VKGKESEYWWADRLGEAWRVLREFPQIIIGHRAAITAFDSGPLRASDEELARGWRQVGDVVVTSPITSYDDVVGGVSDEFGELWIFDADEEVPSFSEWDHLGGQMMVITLADPAGEYPDGPPTWEAELVGTAREQLAFLQQRLRQGLRDYRPLTFLRDELIVTRDPVAIAAIEGRLSSAERCQCRARGEVAWVRPSPDEFTAPYDLIERNTATWNALYRCRTCGAYWVLEQGPENNRDTSVAVRIQSAQHWQSVDLVDGRRRLLVEREGESDRPCRRAGCPRKALKDRQICVDHAYGLPGRQYTLK
jgi:hypothetical protein